MEGLALERPRNRGSEIAPHVVGSRKKEDVNNLMREWTDKVTAHVKEVYDTFDPEKTVLEKIAAHQCILEIGSGLGRYTKLIPRIIGLEYSRQFLSYCSQNVRGVFVRGNGFHIPFRDNTFDCVFSSGVLEHFEDKSDFVREHIRVCRPGGTVIIAVPAEKSPDCKRYMLQVEHLNKAEDKDWRVYGPRMSDEEMRSLLAEGGLERIEILHLGTPLRGWKVNIKQYLDLISKQPSISVFKGLFLEVTGLMISTRLFRRVTGDFILKRFSRRNGNYLYTSGVKPLQQGESVNLNHTIESFDDLVNVLVCPTSQLPLLLDEGRLVCNESKRAYPIVDGIPYLAPEDAIPL